MGSLARHAKTLLWFHVGLLALVASLQVGCETKRSSGTISGAQFVSPQKAEDGLQQLTTELDLRVAAGIPDSLTGSTVTPMQIVGGEKLLLFVSAGNAFVSADLCSACSDTTARSEVLLHYSRLGLEARLSEDIPGVVGALIQMSTTVKPLRLGRNPGWVIAYETSTETLLAFRYDPNFRPDDRVANSQNKGNGNGVIISTVIRKQDIALQLRGDAESQVPQISRLHELPDGDVLVFFQSAASQLEDVYRLQLRTESRATVVDLDAVRVAPVDYLVGEFIDGEEVWVSKQELLDAANPNAIPGTAADAIVDQFQPITAPNDGSVVLFESTTSSLLRLIPDGLRAVPERFATAADIIEFAASPAPYTFGISWVHPTKKQLLLVEEQNDIILAIDYETYELSEFVPLGNLTTDRRDPRRSSGQVVAGGGAPPAFLNSENELRENRLIFDTVRDELLAISYDTGQAVIVLKEIDYFGVTGNTVAGYNFIFSFGEGPGGVEDVRIWDSVTFSLFELRLKYANLPVIDEKK